MIDLLKNIEEIERLELYVNFIKNKKQYSEQERKKLESYFEDG